MADLNNPFYKPDRPAVTIPKMASTTSQKFSFGANVASIEGDQYAARDINKQPWMEPLDPNVCERIFDNITQYSTVLYQGTPITTLSEAAYGTVSLWWVIVAANGYCHPDEIPNGAVLNIPSLNQIQTAIMNLKNERGNVVILPR